jgi:hypothetical protein
MSQAGILAASDSTPPVISITTTFNVADSPATWTKNANTKFVTVYGWAGGGGGGSGRKGTSASAGGGAGASGGGAFIYSGPASAFNNTESVTIGSGGNGGASQTTNATNGITGIVGNNTRFGNMVCIGGVPGLGGNTSTIAGATTRQSFSNYTNPISATNAGGDGRNIAGATPPSISALTTILLTSSGGGGGGGANITSQLAGGSGGNFLNALASSILIGPLGGLESTGINGGNGNPPLTAGGIIFGGTGGGGGGGYSVGAGGATAGGNGGIGAIRGGGGGGGGGGIDSVANSGAGGNGGPGQVIVIEFM